MFVFDIFKVFILSVNILTFGLERSHMNVGCATRNTNDNLIFSVAESRSLMCYITEMISYVDNSNGCLSSVIVLESYLFEYRM